MGKFACACLEDWFGPEPLRGVDPALRYFESAQAAGALPPDVPRLPSAPPIGDGAELEIGAELGLMVEREARRQEIAVGDVVNHMVFAFLAHLEATEPASLVQN